MPKYIEEYTDDPHYQFIKPFFKEHFFPEIVCLRPHCAVSQKCPLWLSRLLATTLARRRKGVTSVFKPFVIYQKD